MIKKRQIKQVCNFLLFAIVLCSCELSNRQEEIVQISPLFQWAPNSQINLFADNTAYSGGFTLNGCDTFYYNIGYNVNPLSEKCPEIIYDKHLVNTYVKSNDLIYVSNRHYDTDVFRKNNVYFIKIGNYKVKMIYPVDTLKHGLIGIYIDSFLNTELGNIRMHLFCEKMKRTSYESTKRALHNINFSEWDTTKIEIPYGSYYIN